MARKVAIGAGVLCSALLAGSCASVPKPVEQLTRAKANVRAAETAGARDDGKSQLHLKYAEDQIDEAVRLLQDDDDDERLRARRLLEKAAADAELAMVLAQAESQKAQAQQTQERIEELQRRTQWTD